MQLPIARCWTVWLTGAAAALAFLPTTVAAQSATFDVSTRLTYDSNVNRAERDNLRAGEGIWSLAGVAGYRRATGANHGVIAKVGLETEVHTDFGDLDALRVTSALTYLIQPYPGFDAPWLAVSAGFALREHAASDIRDGTEARAGIEVGRRWTDRIATRIGYEIRDRDASKSRVFELHSDRLHVLADYALTDRVGLFATYDFTRGGVVTGAPRTPKLRAVSRVRTRDRVFGPTNVAWRLDGETHGLRLGSKFSFAKRTAIELAAQYSLTDADGDNEWNVWNASVALQHRFD